jgi:hypothetical protein
MVFSMNKSCGLKGLTGLIGSEEKEQFAESQKPIDGASVVETADSFGPCTHERALVNVDKGILQSAPSSTEIPTSPMMQVHISCSMCHEAAPPIDRALRIST